MKKIGEEKNLNDIKKDNIYVKEQQSLSINNNSKQSLQTIAPNTSLFNLKVSENDKKMADHLERKGVLKNNIDEKLSKEYLERQEKLLIELRDKERERVFKSCREGLLLVWQEKLSSLEASLRGKFV